MPIESDVIAVIDDDPMMRIALKGLLSAFGYTVEIYASGEAFLQVAATCNALCLLVDVHLGSGSGFDLARQLAVAGFKFPIIFMTGRADAEMAQRVIEAGGVGFLQKPFAGHLLMEILRRSKAGGSSHS